MDYKTIDGIQFYNALISGISNVMSHHEYLNKINVFPVPDGDTGTNLLFTLRPIIQLDEESIEAHFGRTLKLISDMALDSARGNSGTIIAQYFVGISESSENLSTISPNSIGNILTAGFEAAFSSMSEPKEGTIISVMRDVALISKKNTEINDLTLMFRKIYDESTESLNRTPDQMKLLKDSGVVDAGAMGLVNLLEGFLYYIEKQEIMNIDAINNIPSQEQMPDVNIDGHVNSKFQFCTECIVKGSEINRKKIKLMLDPLGDSFILAGTKSKVKIHIHTDKPNDVFDICSSHGDVINQKADDMFKQIISTHNENNIAIVTDSGGDILIDSHVSNIHIVPVRYSFGEKEYIDKISQTPSEFYDELKSNPIHPKTSQPPIGDFLNKFENLSTHYKSIICLHIPEKLSGTIQSCKNAVNKIKNIKITVLDSYSASVGLGLIVKFASKLSSKINDHDKLVAEIKKNIEKTKMFLVVSNIDYAIKGGRVPKFIGLIVKFLKIHPILTVDNTGKLKPASALFGKQNLNIKMAKYIVSTLKIGSKYKFSIAHSNAEDKGHELVDYIENNVENIESIELLDMGTALGVHAGPDSFTIAYQEINDK